VTVNLKKQKASIVRIIPKDCSSFVHQSVITWEAMLRRVVVLFDRNFNRLMRGFVAIFFTFPVSVIWNRTVLQAVPSVCVWAPGTVNITWTDFVRWRRHVSGVRLYNCPHNCNWNESKTKQFHNRFETVLKQFWNCFVSAKTAVKSFSCFSQSQPVSSVYEKLLSVKSLFTTYGSKIQQK